MAICGSQYVGLLALISVMGCAVEAVDSADIESREALEYDGLNLRTEPVDSQYYSLSKGTSNYKSYRFYKYEGYDYDIDVEAVSGSCTVYGHYTGYPTRTSYHKKGDSYDDFGWNDTSENGYYYIRVYNDSSTTSCRFYYNVWRSD